jgi:hypothetical protein
MPFEKEDHLAPLLGKLLAAQTKASASVFVALISTLVKKGALSAEIVETEILKALEDSCRSLPESGSEADRDSDQLEIDAVRQLISVIRRRLFD